MKNQKHFFLYCIISLISLVIYTSCENKRDNSTLGGMWQLVEWRATDGSIAYNKPDTTIYYKVRNNLLVLQELPGEEGRYYLTYCRQTSDSLIINPDKIVIDAELDKTCYHIDSLRRYGIPNNGRLHIDVLNSDAMVLSGEEGTLRFRKY